MRRAIIALLVASIAGLAGTTPRPSPPLKIQPTGSPAISVSDYRGKVVAVLFVMTTCPHCQQLIRDLQPTVKEYAPRGVQFLACAIDEGAPAALPDFIKQFQPGFPVGYCERSVVDGYLQRSVIDARPFYVPHAVVIDRAGVIQGDYDAGGEFMLKAPQNFAAEFDKLLKAPSSGAPAKKAPAPKTTSRNSKNSKK